MAQGAFVWGRGGRQLTPDQIAREREMAQELAKGAMDYSPVGSPLQGLARVAQGLMAGYDMRQADAAMEKNSAYNKSLADDMAQLLAGGSSFPAAPAPAGGIPVPAAQGQISASSPAPDVSQNGDTFSPFIDTVKAGGLTNPYGLAAVAATGRAESGWSPQNAARSWSDPSESGQAGSAGGVMSWRAERLANLRNYAASKGEQGNGSPQTQAEYFMREDPGLIAKLNAAQSPEEAQSLMNNAWKFAGYNRPGGEAARRLGYATAYLPQFQGGGGTEVASVDPAAGMPSAPQPAAYRDPMIVQSPAAAAIQTQAPQETASAPPLPPPVNVSTPPAPPEQQMAQELAQSAPPVTNPNVGILPVLTGQPGQTNMGGGDMLVRALQAMSDPQANAGTQGIAKLLVQQEMAKQDAQRQQALKQMEWSREDRRTAVLDGRYADEQAYKRGQDERRYGLDREKLEADQRNAATTGDIKEYEYYAAREKAAGRDPLGPLEWDQARRKAGAPNTNVNVGGGSDKQVFDEMKASSDAARAAVTGLTSLREARKAVEGGAILGAGADTKLGFQKLAVSLGLANPEAVINTETFRSAIAPQVAAMTKATVGSTQISNADRDFAQDAAGGRITLEKGSILRLLDIMERAGNVIVKQHSDRLNAVYPDNGSFGRERALFGIDVPAPSEPPPQPGKRLRFNPTTGDFE